MHVCNKNIFVIYDIRSLERHRVVGLGSNTELNSIYSIRVSALDNSVISVIVCNGNEFPFGDNGPGSVGVG